MIRGDNYKGRFPFCPNADGLGAVKPDQKKKKQSNIGMRFQDETLQNHWNRNYADFMGSVDSAYRKEKRGRLIAELRSIDYILRHCSAMRLMIYGLEKNSSP